VTLGTNVDHFIKKSNIHFFVETKKITHKRLANEYQEIKAIQYRYRNNRTARAVIFRHLETKKNAAQDKMKKSTLICPTTVDILRLDISELHEKLPFLSLS
jgi:hypothetical protein